MAKDIEPKLKSIYEYLTLKKEEFFVIPEYQRAYSWNITQCDKLWQDIETFIASDAKDPYFFGTIIVDCSIAKKFNLIDGQQRTTTFLLLLKALLLRLSNSISQVANDDEYASLKAGLESNRNRIISILYKAEDEDIPSILKDHNKAKNILILENDSINELYSDEVKKIIEAESYWEAERAVHKISRKQKDNKYTNHFRNFKFFYSKLSEKSDTQLNQFAKIFLRSCQVIEIRSWQVEQAITMFNSLNSTGMPLSDTDIISAQLYSNAGENKSTFNEKWEKILSLANELNSKKVISIDGLLQQFMYVNRADKREYISVREDGNISVDVSTPGLRRYYIEIQKELLKNPLELCHKLEKLVTTWDYIKDYPSVKLLLKFNENTKLFLAGFLSRFEPTDISRKAISDICDCLLRLFAILELSDLGFSSTKFKTFLFGENIKLVDKNILINSIKSDFDEHIRKNWKPEDIYDEIIGYEKNILVFLNEYIYSKNQGVIFDFAENVNIEHIMPSSGHNSSTIRQDAGIVSKEEFNCFVNKLGNKILLEEDINKSIGCEWFKTKKQSSIEEKKGYKNSKYSIAQSLTTYNKDLWAKEDIDLATQKAADRIVKFIFGE